MTTTDRRIVIAHRIWNFALALTVIGAMIYVVNAGVLPTEFKGH